MDSIRASTSKAPAPVLDTRHVSSSLSSFEPVTVEEIGRLLRKVPAKQCSLDPVPTWLIKQLTDHLSPVISHLCNISIQSGEPVSERQISDQSLVTYLSLRNWLSSIRV